MKLNVGNLESALRIFIGVCLTYATLHSYVGGWGYLGVYILATGLARFDLFKAVLGINGYHGDEPSHH